jgi:hypothetical protein
MKRAEFMRIRFSSYLICFILWGDAVRAIEDRPADPLLALVPGSAAGVLVVEDLAEWWPRIEAQPILHRIQELPQIQDSTATRDLQKAKVDLEALLGIPLDQIRDRLLGKALVLSLHNQAEQARSPARGLLLVQLSDRALAERLIAAIERGQSDMTRSAQQRTHQGFVYTLRQFHDPDRPEEAWLILPGDRLVWSNSESLVRDVIDHHQSGEKALLARQNFARVHQQWRLDGRSVIGRLYLDLTQLPAQTVATAVDAEMEKPVRDWLEKSESLSLVWRWDERITFDLDLYLRRGTLAASGIRVSPRTTDPPDAEETRASESPALSAAPQFEGCLDAGWLYRFVLESLRFSQPEQAVGLHEVLRGILLGQDPADGLADSIGPRYALTLEPQLVPTRRWNWLFACELRAQGEPRIAFENAVRTVFAAMSLDTRSGTRVRLPERAESPPSSIYLAQKDDQTIAIALLADRCLVSNSRAMLEAAVTNPNGNRSSDRSLPPTNPGRDATASLTLHAERVHQVLEAAQRWLVAEIAARDQRPPTDVERDFAQVHALLGLIHSCTLRLDWSEPEDRIRIIADFQPRP